MTNNEREALHSLIVEWKRAAILLTSGVMETVRIEHIRESQALRKCASDVEFILNKETDES